MYEDCVRGGDRKRVSGLVDDAASPWFRWSRMKEADLHHINTWASLSRALLEGLTKENRIRRRCAGRFR
jgi:hypothetical protein